MLGLSSSYGTSTVSLTLVGSRVSTALFTSVLSNCSDSSAPGCPAWALGRAGRAVPRSTPRGGTLRRARAWLAAPAREAYATGARRRQRGSGPAAAPPRAPGAGRPQRPRDEHALERQARQPLRVRVQPERVGAGQVLRDVAREHRDEERRAEPADRGPEPARCDGDGRAERDLGHARREHHRVLGQRDRLRHLGGELLAGEREVAGPREHQGAAEGEAAGRAQDVAGGAAAAARLVRVALVVALVVVLVLPARCCPCHAGLPR